MLSEQSERPPLVLFRGFGDSALRFQAHVFIEDINRRFQIESDLYVAVHRCLSEAGVEIPYPQRDLHLKTVPPGHSEIAGVEPDPQVGSRSSGARERVPVSSS